MDLISRPIIYISYRWVDTVHEGRQARAPDPRGLEIADRLRESGVDVRFDRYFHENRYGYKAPQRVAADPRDPWLIWSTSQVAAADVVLMLCVPGYIEADPDHGAPYGEWGRWNRLDEPVRIETRAPSLWWDWHAIAKETDSRPQKFIPVGFGPYHADQIPIFVRGASYINLSEKGAYDALLRRIREVWHEREPRRGVFISYAHNDDEKWLESLLTHLSWLSRQHGVEFWTDKKIEAGAKWHDSIQAALDRAKVAILLVSPDFLNSSYIQTHELPDMLEAAEGEGMTIFWIPLRPSSYKNSPIAKFQAAHSPDKPLSGLRGAGRDSAFVEIGDKLAKVLGVSAA